MAGIGLATGAGAAEGLETLLTRMRADEEMQRRQAMDAAQIQHIRTADQFAGRTQDRLDRSSDLANESGQAKLDMLRQITGLMRSGEGESAGTQSPLIAGSKVDTSSGEATVPAPNSGVDPNSGEASNPAPRQVSGFSRLDTPEGRTSMQAAGLNPNESFGPVRAPKGPEDLDKEEAFLTGRAKKHGFASYKEWAAADPEGTAAAHKEWVNLSDNPQRPVGVQTLDADGRPVTQFVIPKAGATYASKPPAQQITRADNAKRVGSHIDEIMHEADQLDRAGLMGPIAGRWSDFAAGKWGSANDIGQLLGRPVTPQEEEMISEFKTDVGLLKSGMAMVHGGARGGGSIEMNKRFDEYMNSNHADVHHFRGATRSFQKWLKNYSDLSPDMRESDKPDAGGTDDLYNQYLKRTGAKPPEVPK